MKMKNELEGAGLGSQLQFVIINDKGASNSVSNLTNKCDFPVFQDTTAVNAWAMHAGKKDDMYIYDKQGNLAVFLPVSFSGDKPTNLGSGAGYTYVKDTITSIVGVP